MCAFLIQVKFLSERCAKTVSSFWYSSLMSVSVSSQFFMSHTDWSIYSVWSGSFPICIYCSNYCWISRSDAWNIVKIDAVSLLFWTLSNSRNWCVMLTSSLSFIFSSSFLKVLSRILPKLTIGRVWPSARSRSMSHSSFAWRRLVKGVLIFFYPLHYSRLCVPSASVTTPENRPENLILPALWRTLKTLPSLPCNDVFYDIVSFLTPNPQHTGSLYTFIYQESSWSGRSGLSLREYPETTELI
jgi:hypothetical protein